MPSIADVVDLIAAQLTGVDVKLGQEFVNENESPPRVVFVPTNDRFGPAQPIDKERFHTRSIRTRATGIEARIWGAAAQYAPDTYPDLRATELLLDRVVLAIWSITQGSVDIENGEWMDASPAQLGRGYILRFRVGLPVVPTFDAAEAQTTTFTEVLSADSPAAITSTLELASDETAVPSP